MMVRYTKLNRRRADLENQLIDVRGSSDTHVNVMRGTPTSHRKRHLEQIGQ